MWFDARRFWNEIALPAATGSGHRFRLDGETYRYATNRYHPLWLTERAVEYPIALEVIGRSTIDRTLEVGNVLAWVGVTGHVVVGKYEVAPCVVNEDVISYAGGPFSTIIGISTVEHVGWDESPRDITKAGRAIDHLVELLEPHGEMLLTVPVGYHRVLDDEISEGRWGCIVRYLRRTEGRRWEQVDYAEAASTLYGFPFVGASAVAILRWSSHGHA